MLMFYPIFSYSVWEAESMDQKIAKILKVMKDLKDWKKNRLKIQDWQVHLNW